MIKDPQRIYAEAYNLAQTYAEIPFKAREAGLQSEEKAVLKRVAEVVDALECVNYNLITDDGFFLLLREMLNDYMMLQGFERHLNFQGNKWTFKRCKP